jgi:tetratricopeptide (TPR) repeat protein
MRRYLTPILLAACLALPVVGYVGCSRAVDLRAAAELDQAQKAFDRAARSEDFLKVASMYDALRDRGMVSGAALYNQGNALVRAGQRGRAIAAYREATRYRPRDPRLRDNLDFALGSRGDASVRRPLVGYVLFWQDWISYPAKFRMAGAAAVATFLLAVVGLFWQRRLFRRLAVAGVVVTTLLCFAAAYDWYRFDYQKHGVVVEPKVIARMGYAESYQPAFTDPLAEGTEFTLVDRRGDWLLIRLPGDGNPEGWIEKNAAVVY